MMKYPKHYADTDTNRDIAKLITTRGFQAFARYLLLMIPPGQLTARMKLISSPQVRAGSPLKIREIARLCHTTVQHVTDFCNYLAETHSIDEKAWKEKKLIRIPRLRELASEYAQKLLLSHDKLGG